MLMKLRKKRIKDLIENAENNNEKSKSQYNSDEKSQKHVIILGNSIVKHLNGWEMTRELKNCKVKVMSFSGATADCMTDYMKPSLRENPNHFILHLGTNDLISNNSAKCIAESIIEKAVYLKNDKHDVSISSIVLRKDNLKNKVDEVNNNLKEMCTEKNIFLIDHSKSIKQRHINRSKVHLNMKGSTVLGKTFVNHISSIFNCRLTNCTENSGDEYMSKHSYADDLKYICLDNLNKLVIVHLNINSIRNKFDFFLEKIKGNVDILMLSETKLDDSFPMGQFLIDNFSEPIRVDRNKNGGGILLYIREDIPSNILSFETLPIKGFYVEINLHKKKWLLSCSYNPDKGNINNHLAALSKSLDIYSSEFDHFIVLGDFNVGVDNNEMKDLCLNYNLKSLICVPTCYKNPDNPSCIDLILTNSPGSFQSSCAIETGLSDFHKMTVTVMKTSFQKLKPRVIIYRDYDSFCNEVYRDNLTEELSKQNFEENSLEKFLYTCRVILDRQAPRKKKYVVIKLLL